MTISTTRLHPAAVLALLGGLLALGSLLLQWFTFDANTLERFMLDNMSAAGVPAGAIGSSELRAGAEFSAEMVNELGLQDELVGYRALSVFGLVTFVIPAFIGLGAAVRVLGGDAPLQREKIAFLIAGATLLWRPLEAMNGPQDLKEVEGLGFNLDNLVGTGLGVYVAIVGAIMLLGAAAMAMLQPRDEVVGKAITPIPTHEPGAPHQRDPAFQDIHPEGAYAPIKPYEPGALVSPLTPAEQAEQEAHGLQPPGGDGPAQRREGASVPPPGF